MIRDSPLTPPGAKSAPAANTDSPAAIINAAAQSHSASLASPSSRFLILITQTASLLFPFQPVRRRI